MFLIALGMACSCMWLAFQMYWQAQETERGFADVRERIRKSHEYLKEQLPRGCGVNVRKTVVVDYANGIPNDYDWDEEFEKTRALPESTSDASSHDSGMRSKIR